MWGLTQQEQRAALFLLVTFGAGCLIVIYRKNQPPPPINPNLAAQVRSFVQAVQHDSTASTADSASHARAGELKLLRPPARGLVDLNEATFAELEQLPGVGAVMAERILAYRQRKGRFTKVEELAEVKGIGRKRLEALQGLVKVE